MKKLIDKYLRSWDGPFTKKLEQTSSVFEQGHVPVEIKPNSVVSTICGFCSTGCALKVHLKDGDVVNLTADHSYPVNKGMACPKGWEALTPLKANDRATHPLLKENGEFKKVSWDKAIQTFLNALESTQNKYGKESLAFLSTGQIATEEMAFLGALAKFGLGFVHGDGNTRQCMATAVTAYKQSFGFDAPPYTYKDFDESDTMIFVGANPAIAHPIMWKRVMNNIYNPHTIVLDPRATETAIAATQHLALKPKSDLILLYYVAKRLIENNWIDKEYIANNTQGFDQFSNHVNKISKENVLSQTGLTENEIESLIQKIHEGKKVSFWWTMGVNQSYEGVRTAQAIINLALITGNIGKPGTGANSITGQCNAMGSRLFSNTTNLLGGYDFKNKTHREKVANILNIPVSNIPDKDSLSYYEIIDAIEQGKIKALWVIATNTAHSWVNLKRFKEIRKKLDLLVVQDMYHTTETAQMADIILPAAAWGEKEGTFINSERRIGRIRKVCQAPGEALSDFNIFRLIAHLKEFKEFKNWSSPEYVFQIMKSLSKDQPCDFSGIENYAMLDEKGGIQWPYKTGSILEDNERRLFSDGKFYHTDKKAKILFEKQIERPEEQNTSFPFVLLTGRGSSAQWHTQTRTSKSAILRKLYPEHIYCEISVEDSEKYNIQTNDVIDIKSRRGKIRAKAQVSTIVKQGQVFVPMHYNTTNILTMDSFDPYSKQPSYKYATVSITKC